MDWSLAPNGNWLPWSAAVLAAAGLLTAAWLLFRRRRSLTSDAERLVEVLRRSDPDLSTILGAVVRNGDCARLLESPEAREAFALLLRQHLKAHRKDSRTATLALTQASLSRRTAAPGVRLVRAIYQDAKLRERLPDSADRAADRLLDALTG